MKQSAMIFISCHFPVGHYPAYHREDEETSPDSVRRKKTRDETRQRTELLRRIRRAIARTVPPEVSGVGHTYGYAPRQDPDRLYCSCGQVWRWGERDPHEA